MCRIEWAVWLSRTRRFAPLHARPHRVSPAHVPEEQRQTGQENRGAHGGLEWVVGSLKKIPRQKQKKSFHQKQKHYHFSAMHKLSPVGWITPYVWPYTNIETGQFLLKPAARSDSPWASAEAVKVGYFCYPWLRRRRQRREWSGVRGWRVLLQGTNKKGSVARNADQSELLEIALNHWKWHDEQVTSLGVWQSPKYSASSFCDNLYDCGKCGRRATGNFRMPVTVELKYEIFTLTWPGRIKIIELVSTDWTTLPIGY